MNYSFFEKRPRIRDTLISKNFILTGAEIIGKVSLNESVNAGDELNIGSCVISTIEFQLSNMNGSIAQLSGEEFVWKQAVETGRNGYQRLARAARSNLVCVNGAAAYVASSKQGSPYLAIWDAAAGSKIGDAGTQPAKEVKGLAVVGDKLYCLHDENPFLTPYQISGNGLSLSAPPSLNSFQLEKIKYLCKTNYSCNVQGSVLKEYSIERYDQSITNLIETVYEYIQMGVYIAGKPTKVNDTLIKVSCSDRMSKFDTYVDDWLGGINYPIALSELLRGLCNYCGITARNFEFLNADFLVQKNFTGNNVNGLQVLRWIVEAAASFGRMTSDGKLEISWYQQINYNLTQSEYISIQLADFDTDKIEKLQIQVVENDIGVIVPADGSELTNAYIIQNNPLVYSEVDSELRPTAQKIFDKVKGITYRPYEIKIAANPLLHAGQIINVTTINGLEFQAYIMNRSLSGGIDTLEAVGNQRRSTQSDSYNQSIQQIRGSVHNITNTIEQINSTITSYQEKTEESLGKLNENLEGFTEVVTDTLGSLQAQVDGQIESWFYEYAPTLNNKPASDWNTNDLKDKHLGDLFYNSKTGIGYRFSKINNQYSWEVLKDTDIGKALADAQKAQDTADRKRRVFTAQPTPPYDVGDLWVNATYSGLYANDLLRCKSAKTSGNFAISDWEKASKYTDDAKANEAMSGVRQNQSSINQLSTEISSKVSQTDYDSNNEVINDNFSSVIQRVDSVTTTIQGDDGSLLTELKQDKVKYAFDGISSGELTIEPDGIHVYKNNVQNLNLGNGRLRITKGNIDYGFLGYVTSIESDVQYSGISLTADKNADFFVFGVGNGENDDYIPVVFIGTKISSTDKFDNSEITFSTQSFLVHGDEIWLDGKVSAPELKSSEISCTQIEAYWIVYSEIDLWSGKNIRCEDGIYAKGKMYAKDFVKTTVSWDPYPSPFSINRTVKSEYKEPQNINLHLCSSPDEIIHEYKSSFVGNEGLSDIYISKYIDMLDYQVFIQSVGNSDVKLISKQNDKFTISGLPGQQFDYQIIYHIESKGFDPIDLNSDVNTKGRSAKQRSPIGVPPPKHFRYK